MGLKVTNSIKSELPGDLLKHSVRSDMQFQDHNFCFWITVFIQQNIGPNQENTLNIYRNRLSLILYWTDRRSDEMGTKCRSSVLVRAPVMSRFSGKCPVKMIQRVCKWILDISYTKWQAGLIVLEEQQLSDLGGCHHA
jgi:hypothetical protein